MPASETGLRATGRGPAAVWNSTAWAGLIPNEMAQVKPNHYAAVLDTILNGMSKHPIEMNALDRRLGDEHRAGSEWVEGGELYALFEIVRITPRPVRVPWLEANALRCRGNPDPWCGMPDYDVLVQIVPDPSRAGVRDPVQGAANELGSEEA